MAYIDKNMSHKSGTGAMPEPRRINIDSNPSPAKKAGGGFIRQKIRAFLKHCAKYWKLLSIVAVIVLVGILSYGYITTRNALQKAANPTQTVQDAKQELVARVGKLVDLPTGETPSTATVSDASKLQTQTFFARAKNGDKILVFPKAGRAVLYRPSTNKVIEYSTVNLSSTSHQ